MQHVSKMTSNEALSLLLSVNLHFSLVGIDFAGVKRILVSPLHKFSNLSTPPLPAFIIIRSVFFVSSGGSGRFPRSG